MGVQHVDDILLGSQVYCADCIIKSISMIFPNDMGFECEERGKRIRFLTTFLITHGCDFECRPYNPNIDFVFEREPRPKVSRCPWYLDGCSTPWEMLRSFIHPHVYTICQICGDNADMAVTHAKYLALEALDAEWSKRSVARCFISKRFKHLGPSFAAIHKFGEYLKSPTDQRFKQVFGQ